MGDGADRALEEMLDTDEFHQRLLDVPGYELDDWEREEVYNYDGSRIPGPFERVAMPKVTKRTTAKKVVKKKPTNTGGIRDKIKPVGDANYGLKMVLYGKTKTGKTTLAADFPKKLMIVGTMDTLEDGTLSISDVKGVDFFPLESTKELDGILDVVVKDQYKTLVLDTGGGLYATTTKEYLELDEIPVQRSWGMASQKEWGAIVAQTKYHFKQILNVSMIHGVNVVIIAHEKVFSGVEDEDENSLDIAPSIGPMLSNNVAAWLNGACDYICQTFIRRKYVIKERRATKGKTVKTKVPTDDVEYCLRIGPHNVYQTGFRKPKAKVIPDVIVDPSFEKIRELIKG